MLVYGSNIFFLAEADTVFNWFLQLVLRVNSLQAK